MTQGAPTDGPRPFSREALVGVAVAGVLVGAVVAAAVGSRSGDPAAAPARSDAGARARHDGSSAVGAEPGSNPSPVQTGAAPVDSTRLDALVEALEDSHRRLHAADPAAAAAEQGADGLPVTLTRAVRTDEWLVDFRLELHRAVGAGVLVDGAALTDAARATLEWLEGLESHALDPTPYGMPELAQEVRAHAAAGADRAVAVTAPRAAGPAGPHLRALLRAPTFDEAEARARLRAVAEEASGGLEATPAHVRTLADALTAASASPEVQRRAERLEAQLMAALVRLVLDFRHMRRTGPFDLVTKERWLLGEGKPDRERTRRQRKSRETLQEQVRALVEASDVEAAFQAGLQPVHPHYEAMRAAWTRYQRIAGDGGCPDLVASWRIRPDTKGAEVERLQRRLACEGYYEGPIDGVYTGASIEAVKAYQRGHELNDEGFVFKETIRSMNVPMSRRLEQVELALHRMREATTALRALGPSYLRVNLPAFEVTFVDDGQVVRRHRAIVGTNRLDDDKTKLIQGHINRTALFTTELYEVVVNPNWILPKRVEKGEIVAKLEEDPEYLEKQNIREVELDGGQRVLIQGQGEGNVLGKVKFLLETSNAIYLHDTDKPYLFRERRRDFSHGCIRVDDAVELAKWLLVRDGWDPDEVSRSLRAKSTQRGMDLASPVKIVTEYVTVDIGSDGLPVFLTDIYKYDRAYRDGKLPPEESVRWGHATLRPHWVPRVDEEVVEGWRAAGKSAPRNYDPTSDGG